MKKGFTLIELLVVISIIMILVAIGMTSYQNAQKSGRDGRRKADLKQVQSALEMYRADNNFYPSSTGGAISSVLDILRINNYISSLPEDPKTGNLYYYVSASPYSTYNLCAYIENTNDPDVKSPSPLSPCGAGTISCGTSGNCNYGVKNP